ncbi:hypothetical protein GJ496_001583 [Pomphorhynchus laevis]|nr:hypothetical protein GJ496_001583 [Pomphorhynchus laevis]
MIDKTVRESHQDLHPTGVLAYHDALLKYHLISLCSYDSGLTGDSLNQLQAAALRSVLSRHERDLKDKLQLALTRMNTDELSSSVYGGQNRPTRSLRKHGSLDPVKVESLMARAAQLT